MKCTHHIYKSVNCVYYCCLCGARIDPPKKEKPPAEAAQAAAEGNEPKKRGRARKQAD